MKFDGTNWTTYTTAEGLAYNIVFSVAIDAEGNKWFGTGAGVSKLDDSNTAVSITNNPAAVQVFPNPTNEVLYLSGIENARVQIFYLAGKLLLNLPSVNNQIKVKNLPNGIYTIQISNQNQATACKFVKQ